MDAQCHLSGDKGVCFKSHSESRREVARFCFSRFLRMFLLPKLRSDYAVSRHVNAHHYMSLKKAIYKPTAFFKGIVIPLCEVKRLHIFQSSDLTLREATIISSVIAKSSVPSIYSAAALAKLCQLDYSGPRSVFLRTMLDKKYALPLPLIEVVIAFFKKNTFDGIHRPVLWHQCLLVLVQRYKNGLSGGQRLEILGLASRHRHPEIGLEIERELSGQSESRTEYMEQ